MRSDTPAIVAVIRQANAQSATFHHLLEIINTSDAIVFVQEGECPHGARACFIGVTAAGETMAAVDTGNTVRSEVQASIHRAKGE